MAFAGHWTPRGARAGARDEYRWRPMTRAIVLGAGMVGSLMARDLAADPGWEVTAADHRREALARFAPKDRARPLQAELGAPAAIARAVEGHDIVLGALSSSLGLQT